MRVLWLGINDETGCVRHWHDLRCELRDRHGVELVGPGYSWQLYEKPKTLSWLFKEHGIPDWFVLDDANALGYPPVLGDMVPPCRFAWREHDYHNQNRIAVGRVLQNHHMIVLGTSDRHLAPMKLDPFRHHPGWFLVPHPVNTERFHPDNRARKWNLGLYGKTGRCYEARTQAALMLRYRAVEREDVWLPRHGGYWKDGRGSVDGLTYYNDELAEALRDVRLLWVDGSDYNGAVLKYFEGAASGCCLIGQKPYRWDRYFPEDAMIECEPDQVSELADWYLERPHLMASVAKKALDHVREHHSVPARARQVMDILEMNR